MTFVPLAGAGVFEIVYIVHEICCDSFFKNLIGFQLPPMSLALHLLSILRYDCVFIYEMLGGNNTARSMWPMIYACSLIGPQQKMRL